MCTNVVQDIQKSTYIFYTPIGQRIKYGIAFQFRKEYNTIDMFAWEKELDGSFWKDIFEHYCTKSQIRTFAPEILNKLRQEGHEIYIITARCPEEDATEKNIKKSNNMLKKWLKSNKVKYDKIN